MAVLILSVAGRWLWPKKRKCLRALMLGPNRSAPPMRALWIMAYKAARRSPWSVTLLIASSTGICAIIAGLGWLGYGPMLPLLLLATAITFVDDFDPWHSRSERN